MWRKHKSANETDRTTILKEINELNDKIDTIQAHKNACNRIIVRCEEFKGDYKKEIEYKEKANKLIKEAKQKKVKNG